MGRYTFHRLRESAHAALRGRRGPAVATDRLPAPGAAADLSGAMTAAIERLTAQGWEAEAEARFGFAFIRRAGERRLLMLTPRDPYDTRPQSFNGFPS